MIRMRNTNPSGYPEWADVAETETQNWIPYGWEIVKIEEETIKLVSSSVPSIPVNTEKRRGRKSGIILP